MFLLALNLYRPSQALVYKANNKHGFMKASRRVEELPYRTLYCDACGISWNAHTVIFRALEDIAITECPESAVSDEHCHL